MPNTTQSKYVPGGDWLGGTSPRTWANQVTRNAAIKPIPAPPTRLARASAKRLSLPFTSHLSFRVILWPGPRHLMRTQPLRALQASPAAGFLFCKKFLGYSGAPPRARVLAGESLGFIDRCGYRVGIGAVMEGTDGISHSSCRTRLLLHLFEPCNIFFKIR
jgi:hypothetical protein